MNRSSRTVGKRTRRSSLLWEGLETRRLLSGASIWTVNPQTPVTLAFEGANDPNTLNLPQFNPNAPAATIYGSPSALDLGFSSPTAFFAMPGDVDLQEYVNGAWTSVLNPSSGLTASYDAMSLQLQPNVSLGDGLYRLVLPANTDFNFNPTDETFAEFQVALPQPAVLSNAINLGTIGPNISEAKATLDFQTNPTDVKLYKITLPAGHLWQLGLEVDSFRLGGSLTTALALFDSQGNLISAATTGRPDVPQDPYLFTGLQPGTYYVGVSSAVNVAGQPGGYDPNTATPGVVDSSQTGGPLPFTLDLVANPADSPTSLINFTLNRADPNSTAPTGFTVQFSAALAVGNPLTTFENGIKVVDQHGNVFGITPVGYNEANAEVTYLFNAPLPQGQYSVILPDGAGLKDLAGRSPIAPGEPSGVLASFKVGPTQAPAPLNLGALLPTAAIQGMSNTSTLELAPGQSVTIRFVVAFPGTYDFHAGSNGPFNLSFVSIHGASSAMTTTNLVNDQHSLNPGVYEYEITSLSSSPLQVQWGLGASDANFENLLLNGVGQGPALNLRLIDPTAVDAQSPTPSPTPNPAPTPSSPSGGFYAAIFPVPFQTEPNTSGASSPSVFGDAFAGINAIAGTSQSAALTAGGQPVGLPTSAGDHVAVVGSSSSGTDVAAVGTPTAILQALVRDGDLVSPLPDNEPAIAENAPNQKIEPQTDGSIVFDSVAPKANSEGQGTVKTAAIDLGWFDRLRDGIDDFLSIGSKTRSAAANRVQESAAPLDPLAGADSIATDDARAKNKERIDHAALISPLSIGLASLLLLRARRRRLRGAALTDKTTAIDAPKGVPARPNHPRGPLSVKGRKNM